MEGKIKQQNKSHGKLIFIKDDRTGDGTDFRISQDRPPKKKQNNKKNKLMYYFIMVNRREIQMFLMVTEPAE